VSSQDVLLICVEQPHRFEFYEYVLGSSLEPLVDWEEGIHPVGLQLQFGLLPVDVGDEEVLHVVGPSEHDLALALVGLHVTAEFHSVLI